MSTELYNRLKKYKIVSDELCVSIVGTIGKVALINNEKLKIEKENLILSENFIKLTPKKNINNLFYFYYFWSFIFQVQADQEYTITSIKTLGIDKWSYIKVPSIPFSDQEKIVNRIKIELDKQEEIRQKIEEERNKI